MEGVFKKFPDTVSVERSRVYIRCLGRYASRLINPFPLHAEFGKARWRSNPGRQIVQSFNGIRRSQRTAYRRHGVRRGLPIEIRRIRKQHGMRFGMRQAERTAQNVTELVMYSHRRLGERKAA